MVLTAGDMRIDDTKNDGTMVSGAFQSSKVKEQYFA